MPVVTFITNDGKQVEAPENSNLLRVSLRGRGGIPFKCGGGLCGTCRCRIESGLETTDQVKDKERNHLTDEDLANGYRMACQTFFSGDISVSWIPLADRPAPTAAIDREGLVLARATLKPSPATSPLAAPPLPASTPNTKGISR